ncbi:MAG: NAD(P)-dependent oxidoreductase [Microgenomates group bacterium]
MKILFTGTSSFIAYWIIKELKEAGHEVTGILRRNPKDYEGIKKERVKLVSELCKIVPGVSFGDDKFLDLIKSSSWDVLCHHAAQATNPRSPDFDWLGALKGNTSNIEKVLEEFKNCGGKHLIITGSLYEANEPAGSKPLDAFNKYGLSKTLTWEVFRYFCRAHDIKLGKLILPIVFGMYEDPKFVSYLVKSWLKNETPVVKTPKYIRDNINVTLAAKTYKWYLETFVSAESPAKFRPSGYVGSQGDFAKLVARELGPRLKIECPLEFFDQVEFPEPKIKKNTHILDHKALGWNESHAWDELAEYYLKIYK